MALYYPSMVCSLTLRFDESLHVVPTPAPTSTDWLAEFQPDSTRNPRPQPLITQRGEANGSFIDNRVPKRGSVELTGYRTAWTFDLTFDFKDLPIDPRCVRSCAVEIHLGAVSADNFARGMRGPGPEGRVSQLLPRTWDAAIGVDTLLMVGIVDEWDVDHSGGGSIVTIKGRDMRGLLIDSPLATARAGFSTPQSILGAINTSRPINQVVQQILGFHPMGGRFNVVVNAAEWENGLVPAPLAYDMVPRHRQGARGQRAGGRPNVPGSATQMTYWDAIVRYCYLVGAIPYFHGNELRIRPSRAIFDQERAGFDPRIATPFLPDRPRQVGDGAPFSVRKLVYGRDTERLKFNRKFAGAARPHVVRCVSMDLSQQARGESTILEARWPIDDGSRRSQAARTTSVAPSGQQAHEEILNVPVPGIRDVGRLQAIAHSLWEEVGRNEMGGTCETKNLASFGGDNTDPDLLRLKPGDGVEFQVDTRALSSRAPLVSTLTDHERTPFDEQVREIQRRIPDENLARVIVATARGRVLEMQRYFRVANVRYDWSETGVGISFDFQNYFVARFGGTRAADEPVQAAVSLQRLGAPTGLQPSPAGTRVNVARVGDEDR